MKKVLLCLMMLVASINGYSQGYRNTGCYKGFAIIDLSVNFYDGNSEINCDLETSHGYQFNPNFFLGGGFGVDVYQGTTKAAQTVSIPFFGQTRVYFTQNGVSPFIDFKGGYRLGNSNIAGKEYNCWYIQPAFGIRFGLSSRLSANAAIVYTHNFLEKKDVRTNRIALQFGLEF